MGQAAITEKQVEQFPDISFKWLLESVDNLIAFLPKLFFKKEKFHHKK